MTLAPLQKLLNNVGNEGKIIVATGFEKLPKVLKIAKSGHTDSHVFMLPIIMLLRMPDASKLNSCIRRYVNG